VFGAVHGTIEFADAFSASWVPSFDPTFFGAEHEQVMHGIYSPAVHFSRLGDKRSAKLSSLQVQSINFRPDDFTLDRFFQWITELTQHHRRRDHRRESDRSNHGQTWELSNGSTDRKQHETQYIYHIEGRRPEIFN